MKLHEAIQDATELSYNEDADMIVGQIGNGNWQICHFEDCGRQAEMIEPKFVVHSNGVDESHIRNGEITENWEIPE